MVGTRPAVFVTVSVMLNNINHVMTNSVDGVARNIIDYGGAKLPSNNYLDKTVSIIIVTVQRISSFIPLNEALLNYFYGGGSVPTPTSYSTAIVAIIAIV